MIKENATLEEVIMYIREMEAGKDSEISALEYLIERLESDIEYLWERVHPGISREYRAPLRDVEEAKQARRKKMGIAEPVKDSDGNL